MSRGDLEGSQMIGRLLERVILAQTGWAKPLGDWLHGIVAAIFGRLPRIRDLFVGTWLGHPLHALLTDVPIGALTASIVLDLIGQPAAADVALALGILTMLAAAVAGYADYSTTDGRARVRATIHSVLILVSLVLFVLSLAIRATGPTNRALPIGLSIIGYLILAGGAYVGGDVAYLLGNMVDRHAWRSTGTKWQPLEVGEIAEGVLVRAKLGIQDLVLVRTGDTVLALHDQCAHAGGPLHEGTLTAGIVECPWHGSRFEMATGRRRRGPTVYDQPTYEVRPAAAGGYEARRSS
jgi:nitrite reductase/ring-hydroxylating ferredoxin subunit/uncharacterized membrane protein